MRNEYEIHPAPGQIHSIMPRICLHDFSATSIALIFLFVKYIIMQIIKKTA